MPTLGNALDFSKYEARNIRAHQLGAAPSSPVTGQLYYNNVDNTLYWWDGTTWQSAKGGVSSIPDASTTTKGIIQLAGDLTGTATNPQIATGVITDADVNAANKDGLTTIPSLRTLSFQPQAAMPGNARLDQIAQPTVSVGFGSQKIVNLGTPTASSDAATKGYVDGYVQGLDSHASVKAASTANLTLSGTQTIDGIALIAGDRVLVKDQTTQAQNGIYSVSATAWQRVTDMDSWAEVPNAYVWVEQGTIQADTGWVVTSDQGGTLETTAITWVQFSGAGQITAGAGLTKTGNTLDVGGTTNRITVGADTVDIAATYIGQASISTLGTITAGVWNGTPVSVAYGGTGQATAKAGRETGLGAAGYYSALGPASTGNTITVPQGTHGLRASRGLLVQVQDETSGAVEIPDIVVAANGDVTVTYGVSINANTKRVTVIG
jgi:Repeat of unknown function (DUF5907)